MDDDALHFINQTRSAAMTTLRADGTPHTVRVGVAVVDGKIWSSGTQTRVRTRHLRRDPRSTLFVFDPAFRWLSLECRVNILDGPGAPQQSLRLFQAMQSGMTPAPAPGKIMWFGAERTEAEFLATMVEEQRLIYEFEPTRTYGMYGAAP
ncbi:MAG: pyridoxamine 5'-phosphate oxidase family protein [Chloroflexota bacterium]|nr:pyridoxamine 5'-phosphate oxidase family protein [Chloroflexota bacterium]